MTAEQVDAPTVPLTTTGARHQRRKPEEPWWAAERLLPVLVLVSLVVVLAIRLGPALVGFRVLAATDLLTAKAPWRDGGTGSTPHNWYLGDSIDAILPNYLDIRRAFLDGTLQLWDATNGPGEPRAVVGNFPSLSPLVAPLWVFPVSWAVGLVALLQLVVAFLGMFAWMRRFQLPAVAAGVAGLLYLGSAFLTSFAAWIPQTSVSCLIPALFWAAERLAQLRTLRAALPLAAVTAALLLGAFPAVAGLALWFAGAYFLVRVLMDSGVAWARQKALLLGRAVVGVGLGVGLSAIQLLPLVERLLVTDLSYRNTQFFAQQPVTSLLSVVYPRLMNDVGYIKSNPIEAYAYVGAAAVVLCLVCLAAGRLEGVPRGVVGFLAIGSLLTAALVWEQGWWTVWLSDVPIFSGNNSGRIRAIFAVLLCAGAGIGLGALLRLELLSAVRRRLVLLAAGAGTAAVVALALVVQRYRALADTSTLVGDIALSVAGAVLVLLLAVPLLRRARTVVTAALVLLVAGCTTISTSYFWPISPNDTFYPEPPVIRQLAAATAGDRMLPLNGFMGSTAGAYGIRSAIAHVFYPDPWKELLLTLDPGAFTRPGQSPTNPAVDLDITDPLIRNPLLDRMSVATLFEAPGRPIAGTVTAADGSAASAVPTSKGSVELTETPVDVPIARQPLRGVRVRVAAQAVDTPGDATLVASVIDPATGTELAEGRLTSPGFGRSRVLDVPIALESPPAGSGGLTLRLRLADDDPAIASRTLLTQEPATATAPAVRLVRAADDGLQLVYADDHGTVWRRTSALPRVRWASSVLVRPDTRERLTAMVDPATPRDSVVLSSAGPTPDGGGASITTVQDDGQTLVADVTAAGSGYLVLADHTGTGFHATVDGTPAELRVADNAFGAVWLEPGRHRVEITYTAPGLRTGAIISAIALIAFAALLVLTRRGRRRRGVDEREHP